MRRGIGIYCDLFGIILMIYRKIRIDFIMNKIIIINLIIYEFEENLFILKMGFDE